MNTMVPSCRCIRLLARIMSICLSEFTSVQKVSNKLTASVLPPNKCITLFNSYDFFDNGFNKLKKYCNSILIELTYFRIYTSKRIVFK